MGLTNYYFYQNCVDLYFDNGTYLRVFFNELTGNFYKRKKIHPILQYFIDHKGLYVGVTSEGTDIMLHNHISPGRAILDTWQNFAGNETVQPDYKVCENSPLKRIEIGLQKVIDRETYHLLDYSCQTFTNMTCNNERKNDDTARVVGGVLLGVGVIALLGEFFGE